VRTSRKPRSGRALMPTRPRADQNGRPRAPLEIGCTVSITGESFTLAYSHPLRTCRPRVYIRSVIGHRMGRVKSDEITRPRASFQGRSVSGRKSASVQAAGRVAAAAVGMQAGDGNSRLIRDPRVLRGTWRRCRVGFPCSRMMMSSARSAPGTAYPETCRHKR
jgi:hypothetical protein